MSVNSSSQEVIKTREQIKAERQQQEEGNNTAARKKIRVRLIPIWLRILLVLVLVALSASAGTVIGYSVMGNGKASDAFKKETWTHIGDLINKK
ncbi:DNA-directed RNA polymerase subunit beta [Niallia sp. 03133]|uniref:DNA-directed RNA polymerase subunit beta n=1 Tax=Niallia sp. 03133 TaxID=3458060 RepID=UPI00404516B5